jgi:RNA polymerase sigma-70 factor (ECF subfamily)
MTEQKQQSIHADDMPNVVQISRDPRDLDLINQVLGGHSEAFPLLIGRYQMVIQRMLMCKLRDQFKVDDAFQSAVLKCFTKLYQFQFASSFGTWFAQIAINEARQALRKERTLQRNQLAYGLERQAAHIVDSTAERIADSQRLSLIRQTFQELPETYRAVMILRYVEGLSLLKIAEELNMTLSTLKSRLLRGKRMTTTKVRSKARQAA